MKNTSKQSYKAIDKIASELLTLRENIAMLEKQKLALTNKAKELFSEKNVINTEKYLLQLSEKSRSGVDRELLQSKYESIYNEVKTVSNYVQLDIKEIKPI
jgi:predicted phage-related endonuclease